MIIYIYNVYIYTHRIPGLLFGQEEEEAEEEDPEIETWLQLPRLKSLQLGQAYR